jgi:hypothetical protein
MQGILQLLWPDIPLILECKVICKPFNWLHGFYMSVLAMQSWIVYLIFQCIALAFLVAFYIRK